jgi:MFS superfamily sulfate permease-like transporter
MQEAGAKTGFAGVFMGLLVTSCLLFFTPLFADIPQVRYLQHLSPVYLELMFLSLHWSQIW